MNVPILSRRRDRREAAITAAAESAAEAALTKAGFAPALAGQPGTTGVSGATYPVPNPSTLTGNPSQPWGNPSSPFMQTGGNYGANPLPRPNYDFGSLFGPGYPLFPDALDPLRPDGRADPRRYQYPVTWNIQLIDREIPWALLRSIATKVDVVSRCIELLQDAVTGMRWGWGFSPQIINQIRTENNEPNSAKATLLAREKYGEELTRIQKFFQRPDERMGYTFIQWMTTLVWSHVVYDGIVLYPSYTLDGQLHSLSALDTSTIKILLDNQGFTPQPPAPAYQQILYGFPRGEFQAEAAGDGTIPDGYRQDQLGYYIRRPRLHTPYGFSAVEESINYATLYQQRQEWMHAEWSHGVTPRLIIETAGTENWTPEQMAYYQNALNDQWSGQTQRRQQLMMLRPGMTATQMHEMAEWYSSEYDQFLVMQIASKFGVPQSQMGIPQNLTDMQSGAFNTHTMDLADKFALDSLVNFLADCINDAARRFLGMGPEITIVASGANDDDASLTQSQADATDVDHGIRTRNEVRAERGLPLMSEPEADELGVTTATGVTFLCGQLEAQEAQLAILEQSDAASVRALEAEPQGRQRSSRLDEPADPDVKPKPSMRKPGPLSATGTHDKPHKPRKDAKRPRTTPKVSGAALSSRNQGGNYTVKELAAFTKFATNRINRGTWRDFDFEAIEPGIAKALNAAGREGDLDTIKGASAEVTAAGIALKAEDTRRVLLVQRAVDNHSHAAGLWEYPGGRLDPGDKPKQAARREFEEETNIKLPKGDWVGSWTTTNGYKCFVYVIPHESDIKMGKARSSLDGSGDQEVENVAWWDVADMVANPALRVEMQSTEWALLGHVKKGLPELGKADARREPGSADRSHSPTISTISSRLRTPRI